MPARRSVLAAAAVAAVALAGGAEAQLTAASSSGSGPSDLCNQTELVDLGGKLKYTSRKIQCQEELKIPEMLKLSASNVTILCDKPTCIAALQVLYNTLPHCRYLDWDPQDQSARTLKQCGIKPLNATEANKGATGSLPGATTATPMTTPAASWNPQTPGSAAASFAPVGVTPSPVAAAPTPTPQSAATSLAAPVFTFAVTILAVTADMP
ncbi:hypothetical protein PybrP1_011002 [[Pythium] brassicae (nom. inval.)]|nr:hypothetical protein PybrP1_011002 [[Pythium] brassicae (nom. inval.)]